MSSHIPIDDDCTAAWSGPTAQLSVALLASVVFGCVLACAMSRYAVQSLQGRSPGRK